MTAGGGGWFVLPGRWSCKGAEGRAEWAVCGTRRVERSRISSESSASACELTSVSPSLRLFFSLLSSSAVSRARAPPDFPVHPSAYDLSALLVPSPHFSNLTYYPLSPPPPPPPPLPTGPWTPTFFHI